MPAVSMRSLRRLLLWPLLPLLLVAAATGRAEGRRPNVLWIFSEDLSPFFGCYGDAVNRDATPAVDEMARQGVVFLRAYATAPVCSPSRSAVITGVMQTTTGTQEHRSSRSTGVVPENLRIHLPAGVKTLPEHMRDAGYFTFNSGKDDYNFHYDRRALYTVGSRTDYHAGMNGWQGNTAQANGSFTEGTWRARSDKSQPWFGQIMILGGKAGARHVRPGAKLADEAVPVPPYFPDTPAQRKAWTGHYNAVRGADAQVEQILRLLQEDGELENTVVFFFSDHGSNHSPRHKQFCYEGGLHIPLVIMGRHPALKPRTVRNDLVNTLDITATTLALCGVPLPAVVEGRPLFAADHQPRDHVIGARDRCDYTIDRIRTVRTDRYRYIRNGFPERTMLQPQYRDFDKNIIELKQLHAQGRLSDYQDAFWFGRRPVEELYLEGEDPHEVRNLAEDPAHRSELERHRKILDDWIAKTGDRGQLPQSAGQLRATYDLWKDEPIFRKARVNPEYDPFLDAPGS